MKPAGRMGGQELRDCVEAGAYVSTLRSETDDFHPWDFGDNYVSHMSWSDKKPAEETARILFDGMGGLVHLGGIASNTNAPAIMIAEKASDLIRGNQ